MKHYRYLSAVLGGAVAMSGCLMPAASDDAATQTHELESDPLAGLDLSDPGWDDAHAEDMDGDSVTERLTVPSARSHQVDSGCETIRFNTDTFSHPRVYEEGSMTFDSQSHFHLHGTRMGQHNRANLPVIAQRVDGEAFTLKSVVLPSSNFRPITFRSPTGAEVALQDAGTFVFPSEGWQGIDSFTFHSDGFLLEFDDLEVCRDQGGQPEVIIDNHKHDAAAAGVSFIGEWPEAGSASEHFGVDGRYAETGGAVDSYRFTPELTGSGLYRVMVWNNCFSPRANNVPHTIVYNGGQETIEVDQDCETGSHGEWLELGSFPFAAGTDGYLEISDQGLAAGSFIGADGARFLRADVIVADNGERSTTSVGDWQPALAATEHYQSVSVFSDKQPGIVDSYRFTPAVITPGSYEVSVWNSCFSPRANNVPHTVVYDGGAETIAVDQDCETGSHGDWLVLGTFRFASGTSGYVEISNDGVADHMYVGADAVRLIPVATGAVRFDDEGEFRAAAPRVSLESFESNVASNFTGSTDITTAEIAISAPSAGLGVFDRSIVGGHATDGVQWLAYSALANEPLTLDFDEPIQALGLYITDWGDFGTGELTFSNDAGESFVIAVAPQSNGNEIFVGLVSPGISFQRVQLNNDINGELIGFDEIYYGR